MNLNEMNIRGYQQQGSEIVFATSEDARIHLTFVSQKTARLYVDFAGDGTPETSYAIEGEIPAIGDIQITEDEGSIRRAEGGSFVQYVFAGDSFADILDEYTALTGRPSMPPLWALGYTQCRCSYWCWDEIDEVIETLREKRFPLDCVVFDFDWADCFHNFKWNKRWNGAATVMCTKTTAPRPAKAAMSATATASTIGADCFRSSHSWSGVMTVRHNTHMNTRHRIPPRPCN